MKSECFFVYKNDGTIKTDPDSAPLRYIMRGVSVVMINAALHYRSIKISSLKYMDPLAHEVHDKVYTMHTYNCTMHTDKYIE